MSTSDAASPQATTGERALGSGPHDEAILTAIRSDERELAAELLLSHYGETIGRACMALLGSQREAEEIVEATFADALSRREGFPGASTLRAWLLGLARRRAAARLVASGATGARARTPAGSTAGANARGLLCRLKPTEREALVLRFIAELELSELAAACAVSPAQAEQRVVRGLASLQRLRAEGAS